MSRTARRRLVQIFGRKGPAYINAKRQLEELRQALGLPEEDDELPLKKNHDTAPGVHPSPSEVIFRSSSFRYY